MQKSVHAESRTATTQQQRHPRDREHGDVRAWTAWASVLGNAAVQRLLHRDATPTSPPSSAPQSEQAGPADAEASDDFDMYSRPERCCPGSDWGWT